MKLFVIITSLLILFTNCSPSKKINDSVATAKVVEPDGSSYEKAIIINKNNEIAGIAEEYKWIANHYQGASNQGQGTMHRNGRAYDIINIQTKTGEKKQVFFDITSFYGKY